MPTRTETRRSFTERIDAAIFAIAPVWGAKRMAVRQMRDLAHKRAEALSRHWEGAESDRLRGEKWLGSRLSPDSALEQDLESLRDRCDELYRSFGLSHGAIENRVDNTVGTGIRPQARIVATENDLGRSAAGVTISEADAKRFNAELDWLFYRLARTCGPGGRESLWDQQRLAERYWQREGEAFLVFSDVGRAEKPIPLQVDVIDPRRVETPPERINDPLVRLGIERNRQGDVVAYWVRETHPHDTVDVRETFRRYPAWRVCHVYEKQWADQSRGLPWFAAMLNDVRDYKDYKEAVIISAQIAACVALVISTTVPPGTMAANGLNSLGQRELSPGQIIHTENADNIQQVNPSQPGTTYGMFNEASLLGFSGGLNWPYGWLTKDRRRSTFSSGKLEEIDGGVVCRVDQQKLRDRALIPFWNLMVDEAVVLGETSIDPTAYARAPWLFREHAWIAPGRPWIDPPKEVGAAIQAKDHNLMPMADILAKLGYDVDEVLTQRARERRREEELGIVPPETQASQAQATAAAAGAETDDETADEVEEVPA